MITIGKKRHERNESRHVLYDCVVVFIGRQKENEMKFSNLLYMKKDWPKQDRWLCWIFIRIGGPFYLFSIFILPNYYLWITEIPPLEQLQVSRGELAFEEKGEYMILSLVEASGRHVYSCDKHAGKRQNCYEKKKMDSQSGQRAMVWWFERKCFPWMTHRYLVRLMVDGKEEIAYGKTVKNIAEDKIFAVYFSVFILIGGLFLIWFGEFTFRNYIEK